VGPGVFRDSLAEPVPGLATFFDIHVLEFHAAFFEEIFDSAAIRTPWSPLNDDGLRRRLVVSGCA
jgi:hypothetical protein